jgi:hypothetical protein
MDEEYIVDQNSNIAAAFRTALRDALAAVKSAEDAAMASASRPLTADDFQRLMDARKPIPAIIEDILEVLNEIQRWRDVEPGFDTFLRQRGIVTRVRSVR